MCGDCMEKQWGATAKVLSSVLSLRLSYKQRVPPSVGTYLACTPLHTTDCTDPRSRQA